MKHPTLPCICGAQPILCYHDHITCFEGHIGSSVYETTRFYRYICPHCHEWGFTHEIPSIAKRFWNEQRKGTRKNFYHKAEHFSIWRNVETNEIVINIE